MEINPVKWKTPPPKPVTPEGATYYCKTFAWLPHQASDGYTYWLESVYVQMKFMHGRVSGRRYWYIAEWIGNKAPEGEVDS